MSGSSDHIKLTKKQEDFCQAYLVSGNATEAYRRVYNCSKMKPATINRKAKVLMDQGKIRARISERQQELQEVSNIKQERLLYELEAMATSSIPDFGDFNSQTQILIIKDFEELTDMQKRSILSMEATKYGWKLRLHNKISAIERISKMLGYDAPRKIDHSNKGDKFEASQMGNVMIIPSNGRGDPDIPRFESDREE